MLVGIPTIGRASILRETLRELGRQTRRPDGIIVCGTTAADVEAAQSSSDRVQVLLSPPGLPRQRNAVMRAASQADIIVFFDDDFLPDPAYLEVVEQQMSRDPHIVIATGLVLADGIGGPGFTPEMGRSLLTREVPHHKGVRATFSGYGCNMAVRLAPVREQNVWFDERLPLYAWQEDVDFSRRLVRFGTVVQILEARGVHLGVKYGRGTGVRLGYSQVANPFYLARKRQGYPLRRALGHIGRNMTMNVARFSRPEPYVDRRGRLLGNAIALRDLVIGRMCPERILEL